MDNQLTIQNHQAIDKLEAKLLSVGEVTEAHIRNIFVPGIYIREMYVPVKHFDGVFITSEIHNTEHAFSLDKGSLIVSDGVNEPVLMKAPFKGITKPGTRRIALVLEDIVWTTYHANPDNENEQQIRERILEKHQNPFITDELRKKMLSVRNNVLTIKQKQKDN